jgi:hypothetical protein
MARHANLSVQLSGHLVWCKEDEADLKFLGSIPDWSESGSKYAKPQEGESLTRLSHLLT